MFIFSINNNALFFLIRSIHILRFFHYRKHLSREYSNLKQAANFPEEESKNLPERIITRSRNCVAIRGLMNVG